jgi:hypothetical protein
MLTFESKIDPYVRGKFAELRRGVELDAGQKWGIKRSSRFAHPLAGRFASHPILPL